MEDKEAAIHQAATAGYYVRSGRPVGWLNAWREWCQQRGRKCVVCIRGAKHGTVEVDGAEVLKCKVADLESTAAKVAAEHNPRSSQLELFAG